MKILFVCTGNSCRSPIAKALFKKISKERGLDVEVKSCGTKALLGMAATKEAIESLQKEGLNISDHKSKQLDQRLIDWADIILVMEERHKEEILQHDIKAKEKIFLLTEFAREGVRSIVDPITKPLEVYEVLVMDLKFYLTKIIERIKNENIPG